MHVFVNAANARGYGSRAVAQLVLKSLAEAANGAHALEAWGPRSWGWTGVAGRHPLHVVPDGWRGKAFAELLWIPARIRRERHARLLSLADTSTPRCRVPHVLLVQQAYLAYQPSELDFELSPRARAKFMALSVYFQAGLAGVDHGGHEAAPGGPLAYSDIAHRCCADDA
jgi:hypothetical protein